MIMFSRDIVLLVGNNKTVISSLQLSFFYLYVEYGPSKRKKNMKTFKRAASFQFS